MSDLEKLIADKKALEKQISDAVDNFHKEHPTIRFDVETQAGYYEQHGGTKREYLNFTCKVKIIL